MQRPTREETFLAIAEAFALRGTCSRAQVGAVIVRHNHIIAHGYNGTPPGIPHCEHGLLGESGPCLWSVHAEANAIAYAAKVGVTCEDAVLYSTHQPCYRCSQLIIGAGIHKVYYRYPYRETEGTSLLMQAGVIVVREDAT